ncbi:MAG: FHA domain-containing protein [Gammaproteobacteria bacterium]
MIRQNPVRKLIATLLASVLCALSAAAWASQDVVLLLDNFAGGRANAAQRQIVQAEMDFIDHQRPDTRIAVVAFDSKPTLLLPLTPVSAANRPQINNALNRLDYRHASTDLSSGLELALTEIIEHGNSDAQKSIVLVTGGTLKTGNQAIDHDKMRWIMRSLVPVAVFNQVRVFSVALAQNTDDNTLQMLADRTGGSYFRVSQPAGLASILQSISTGTASDGLAGVPASSAGNAAPAKFDTPLTQRHELPSRMHWLWLVVLLALIAAAIGIYVARNMQLVRMPKKPFKPDNLHVEGPRAVLYDINNPNDIKRVELGERATLMGRVAGYDPEVQYVLVKEKTVGRCHAVIERRGHSFWIMDQGSINGTFVNGERITADRALKHGDIIAIHRHEFEFMIPEYFESDATIVGAREQLAT